MDPYAFRKDGGWFVRDRDLKKAEPDLRREREAERSKGRDEPAPERINTEGRGADRPRKEEELTR